MLIFSAAIVLSILLLSNTHSQQQQNITSTIAEDFKDCFLDIKSKSVFGVGPDFVYLIGLALL